MIGNPSFQLTEFYQLRTSLSGVHVFDNKTFDKAIRMTGLRSLLHSYEYTCGANLKRF